MQPLLSGRLLAQGAGFLVKPGGAGGGPALLKPPALVPPLKPAHLRTGDQGEKKERPMRAPHPPSSACRYTVRSFGIYEMKRLLFTAPSVEPKQEILEKGLKEHRSGHQIGPSIGIWTGFLRGCPSLCVLVLGRPALLVARQEAEKRPLVGFKHIRKEGAMRWFQQKHLLLCSSVGRGAVLLPGGLEVSGRVQGAAGHSHVGSGRSSTMDQLSVAGWYSQTAALWRFSPVPALLPAGTASRPEDRRPGAPPSGEAARLRNPSPEEDLPRRAHHPLHGSAGFLHHITPSPGGGAVPTSEVSIGLLQSRCGLTLYATGGSRRG
ncbi:60S ribosomal protein L11 [Lates japonicus]|uniref:60S ribosomal protein L11 n=1 Tax=Lates japonicus TaxID=270547 RepID=A0AAD3M4Q9_LATJO|nr:60S ribosomal protein L11 [Lates japonicus]